MIFVEAASKLEARVTVRRCDQDDIVNGKSIMQMMMLAATQGTDLEITVTGPGADNAVKVLIKLVKSGFQED